MDDVWITAAPLAICLLLLVAGARAGAARDRARTEARLAASEREVDALLDHLGVVVPEPRYPGVEQLLAGPAGRGGHGPREQTGADLLSAEQAVDALAGRSGR